MYHSQTFDGKSGKTDSYLQCSIVDADKCIYLVRSALSGPGKPVHVQLKSDNTECTFESCVQGRDMAFNHTAEKNFICKHIKSVIQYKEASPKLDAGDLFIASYMNGDPDISEGDREHISTLLREKFETNSPVVREYTSKLQSDIENERDSSYVCQYFSVLFGCSLGGRKAVCRKVQFNRILVTYNRKDKKVVCECGIERCKHCLVVMLVVNQKFGGNISHKLSEPMDAEPDISQDLKIHLERAKYALNFKRIPFSVNEELMVESPISKFTPTETECHKCSSELTIKPITTKGYIFTLDKKYSGITVENKICSKCSFEYRYQEYSDGYHNYNNSSFFSIKFMETVLNSWLEGVSLESLLNVLQPIIPESAKYKLNQHLVGNATKHYLSLKELDLSIHCLKCGYYPPILVFDAIRNISCDLKSGDIIYDKENIYKNVDDLYHDACLVDVLRGSVGKNVSAHTLKQFGVKPYFPCLHTSVNVISLKTLLLLQSNLAKTVK